MILLAACGDAPRRETIERAVVNGRLAGEAFARSHRFVEGWLAVADTVTGLIPKNLQGDYFWNAQDAAADNYPFMVITSFFTDEGLFRGRMLDMLRTETELTSCLGACPATYDLRTHRLQNNPVDTGNVIFGSAEYMKDGLLPITELLGVSPWSERMISILDSLHGLVEIVTEIRGDYFGNSQVIEVMKFCQSAVGRAPYTPYDVEKSSLKEAWDASGRPYYDYSQYNRGRLDAFAQLDVRVDKTFYFRRCMLGVYLDLQNVTGSKLRQPDVLMSTGVVENPTAPVSEPRYRMKYIGQVSGSLVPAVGLTVEF